MNKLQIFGKVSGAVMKVGGSTLLKCKKYSPELLLAGGIICGVAAIVTAVVATKKFCEDKVLEQVNAELEEIDKELEGIKDDTNLSKEEKRAMIQEIRRRLGKAYWKKFKRMAKIFGLTFALVVAMILLTLKSHGIIRGRYLTTVAAYTALDNSYRDYRQRIRDIAGDEAEQRFFDGTDEIEIKSKDPETGKTVKEKVNKKKTGMSKRYSPYEYDFNPSTAPYASTGNADHDYNYLSAQESTFRDELAAEGFVLLIDVLNKIGFTVRDPKNGQFLVDPKLGWEAKDDLGFGITQYFDTEEAIRETRTAAAYSGNQTTHLNFNAHMLDFMV